MLIDGLTLLEGSSAQNLTIAKGTSFPSLPTEGELFYRTDGVNEGLYVYTGESWSVAGGNAFDPAGNQNITGTWSFSEPVAVGTPTAGNHAVTKAYADALSSGVDPKDSVKAATTTNITLSGTQTVDGVSLAVGDRVLVKNQTLGTQNGLYVVAAGAWTRTSDFDGSPASEVTSGAYTFVTGGATNGQKGFILTTNDPITIGSTPLAWTQFNGVGTSVDLTGATGNLAVTNLNGGGNASATTFWRGDGTWNTAVTSIAVSGGATGLTTSGGPITSSGTITLGGTLAITNGGTGATTATAALTALLPSQTGNSGKVLSTNGTVASWTTPAGSGTSLSATTTPSGLNTLTTALNLGVLSGIPVLQSVQASATANNRILTWQQETTGEYAGYLVNDAADTTTKWMSLTRSGLTATGLTFTASSITLTGAVTGTSFSGNGAALTSLNASNLTTGTVGTARLGSGTANTTTFLRGDGSWSTPTVTTLSGTTQPPSTNSFSTTAVNVGVFTANNSPFIQFMNAGGGADAKKFDINIDPSTSEVSFVYTNDANSVANKVFTLTRSGTTAPLITLTSTGVNLAVGTAGLQLNGSAGTSGQVLTSNGTGAAPTWQAVPGGSLTATQVGYGSAGNVLTGTSNFTFTTGTNTLSIGVAGATTTINGSDASTGTNPAASLTVRAGNGSGFSTNAGSTIVMGGSYLGSNNGSGGNLSLRGGDSTGGTGVGGNVIISGGTGTGNVGGYVSISTSSAAGQAVTERLRFLANGAWSVGSNGTSTGTTGQVLTSQGSAAAPVWSTFSVNNLFGSGSVSGYSATTSAMNVGSEGIFMVNGASTAGNRVVSQTVTTSGNYNINLVNDSGTAATVFAINRSGNTASSIVLTANSVNLAGLSTGLQLNGSAGSTGQFLVSQGNAAAPVWSSSATGVTAVGTLTGLQVTGNPTIGVGGANLSWYTAGASWRGVDVINANGENISLVHRASNNQLVMSYNWFQNSAGTSVYTTTGLAAGTLSYDAATTSWRFHSAPAGTAGNTPAFTQNLNVSTTTTSAPTFTSTVATGTAPLTVTSTTVVPNLNVSQLLGSTWVSPGAIGSTTANTGAFTTLTAQSLNVTGSTAPANGVYLSAANTLTLSSASTARVTINSTGVIATATGTSFDFGARYTELNTAATAVASTTIDCSVGNIFTVTMSASITTLAFSNVPASGRAYSLTLILAQDATGGRSITWPAAVKWPSGTAPTLSAANKVDIVTLVTTNGGTTWYGLVSGQNY